MLVPIFQTVDSISVKSRTFFKPTGTRDLFNLHACDPQGSGGAHREPDNFNLDRFLLRHGAVNPRLAAFDSFELIPFGVGQRMWPGFNLGNTAYWLYFLTITVDQNICTVSFEEPLVGSRKQARADSMFQSSSNLTLT